MVTVRGRSPLTIPLRLRKPRLEKERRQWWQHLNWHSVPFAGNQGFLGGFAGFFDGDSEGFGRDGDEVLSVEPVERIGSSSGVAGSIPLATSNT